MKGLRESLKLIATEGMVEPEWRKRKMRAKIDRDFKKNAWTRHTFDNIDREWQWRIGVTRIQLGIFDYVGWNLREPRGGHIPTFYPIGLDGKLLILGEQGIGDEVMFAGAFNHYPQADIECDARLVSLFERSFHNTFFGRKDLDDKSWDRGGYEHQAFMGDIIVPYWTHPSRFPNKPYLVPDPERVEYWRKELPEDAYALTWTARQGRIDPDKLKGEGNAVSLQYGESDHPDWCYVPDIDLLNDIEDIFAILANVNRVIGVPTSLMHFASSIGKPCEVIMTMYEGEIFNALNWRWGMVDITPWVPTATIYRSYKDYQRSHSYLYKGGGKISH